MAFKKGQSGNPKGRPRKDMTFHELFKKELEEKFVKVDSENITKKEVIVRNICKLAMDGEQWACKFIADRMEGTPVQQIQQTLESTIVNISREDAEL